TPPPDSWSRRRLTELEQRVFPAPPNPEFALPGTLTDEAVAARYNNFYEFSEVKENVHLYARDLKI
ncbi:MAG: protein-methionine-sulfoxide reductase catalytic subunit MsrP, partial [Nitrospinaceae bacterium]|nr:protein-methionine-sulfoxide reductase catalytic subunit MsrP [Nitrospinaceae bacterium]NIR55897.1 protein-methionine-sulfoxide reductase catalytic subunit MsrP [Nitrospinaceae bacterium]NIS86343.1 protein-methionine-sulfoxide reductase catalytic subunit MsrP [Nitrospinaceae bacterium]NIT83179.1 protein-methionine-sulfoxide reductase catalytic subunit MsrP [Nitrospinaceae bacterium]NIU45388.1 protein-methionine-sulfoxide reductase catalytic subunit MsrP [Nitrospinaceae bacterium]